MASSHTARLSRKRRSNGCSSVTLLPSPTPSSTRPWLSRSSVLTRSATRAGWFVGQLDDAVAEADVLRPLARRGEEHLGRRRVAVLLEEVVLDLPRVVVAEPVGQLDLVERVVEQLVLVVAAPRLGQLQLVEDPELHAPGVVPRPDVQRATAFRSGSWSQRRPRSGPERDLPWDGTRSGRSPTPILAPWLLARRPPTNSCSPGSSRPPTATGGSPPSPPRSTARAALTPDAALARLRSTTYDGITIEPLYTGGRPDPAPPGAGHPPYVAAGRRADRRATGGTSASSSTRAAGPGRAVDRAGAGRHVGPARPHRRRPPSTSTRSPALLDGVLLDLAPVALQAGDRWPEAADALRGAVRRAGSTPTPAPGRSAPTRSVRRRSPASAGALDERARRRRRAGSPRLGARPPGAARRHRRRHPLPRRRRVRRPGARVHDRRRRRVPAGARRPRRRPGRRVRPARAAPRGDRRPVRHDRQVPRRPAAVGARRRGASARRDAAGARRSTPSRRRR